MILKSLFTLFRTGVFIVLLNDYLKRSFPEEYSEGLIKVSLKAIHLYSKLQIVAAKVCKQTKELINTNPFLKKIFDEIYKKEVINEICQVKPQEIYIKPITTNILDIHFEENKKAEKPEKQETCFYIFSDNINANNKCVNRVFLYSQPFATTNYEVSNVKFMLLELKINGNAYKIELKNEESNYYIVNNIFDKNFFIYYLNNYHICDNLPSDELMQIEKFDIKLIDQDVNIRELEITDKKFILIKKDEYIY
jgi:hypothetical protein